MINFNLKALFFLALLGVATYAGSLHNPKMLDDHAFFDEKVRNIKNIGFYFLPDLNRALGINDRNQDAFYRPLASVIPMMACVAFHDSIFGYHSFNLGLMVVASWVIMALVRRLWGDERLGLLAAAAFIVHPINGIMVNYITASVFAAQVIFMLASLWFLLSGVIASPAEGGAKQSLKIPAFAGMTISVFFFLLALLCHESALALPFYAVAMSVLSPSVKRPNFIDVAEVVSLRGAFFSDEAIFYAFRRTLPLWITMLVYLLWRMKFAPLTSSFASNFLQYDMSFLQFIASFTHLVIWYLSKLICPVGIVMIQSIPVTGARTWFWLLAGVLTPGVAFAALRLCRGSRPGILGITWLAMGFIPVIQASVFRPPKDLTMEPHWLVFPVIGFFIWFASWVLGLWDQYKKKWIAGAVAVIMFGWMGCSWGMNAIWGDEIAYCHYWLKYSPDYDSVKFFLAKAYEIRHDYDSARRWYRRAAGPHPPASVLVNLGLMDMQQGRLDEAKQELWQAVVQKPNLDMAWNDLGVIATMQGQPAIAQECFRRAIAADRFLILPRLNLAAMLLKSNDLRGAQKEYQAVLDIDPHNGSALENSAKIAGHLNL